MSGGEHMKFENNLIVRLKGPDRVRKRPAVVFDSDGVVGVVYVIKTLLNIFVAEAALGFSAGIHVKVHTDNSISVRSYDRGFILDETIVEGKPVWYQDFCELYCGSRESDGEYYFGLGSGHNALYGQEEMAISKYQVDTDHSFDLCCVQYVSKFMHVEATRNGVKKILDFEKGYSVSDLRKEQTTERANTYIHFLIDEDVFGDVFFPISEIVEFLRNIARFVV